MVVYWITSSLASLLSYVASYYENRGRIAGARFYWALAIAVFCLVAGLRSVQVGTDTTVYGVQCFNYAVNTSFFDYCSYYQVHESRFGILFLLLAWLASNLTRTLWAYLFILEFAAVLPVILICKKVLGRHAYMGILVFGIVLYPATFNMIRQSIAMGIVLYSYSYARGRRLVPFLGCIGIAFCFHASALLGLLVYPIVRISDSNNVFMRVLMLVIICLVFAATPDILNFLGDKVGSDYSGYFNGTVSVVSKGTFRSISSLLLAAGVISVVLLVFQNKTSTSGSVTELSMLSLVGVAAFCLSIYSFYLYRIGFYYLYFITLLLPISVSETRDATTKFFLGVVVLAACLAFSADYYWVLGSHGVVPYVINL